MAETAEITMTWDGQDAYIAHQTNGYEIAMGRVGSQPVGGPMQLLLVALAGCTAMDIVSILRKKRLDLEAFKVKVRGVRAEDYPQIWQELHVTYLLWGNDLKAKDVEQAIELSEDKYCSVGAMLGTSAKLTSEYRIYEPGQKE